MAAAGSEQSTRPEAEMLELTHPECLALLAATSFGRIVVSVTEWERPVIRPVNYVFDQPSQSVLIRSAPGSKLHALLRSPKAVFEIDGADPDGRVGWSVIVGGVTEQITSATELRRIERVGLDPLAPGDKTHWIRIRATTVSGRRIALVTNSTPRREPNPYS